jgi:hypothetical protein
MVDVDIPVRRGGGYGLEEKSFLILARRTCADKKKYNEIVVKRHS